jgi:hypothetical protein
MRGYSREGIFLEDARAVLIKEVNIQVVRGQLYARRRYAYLFICIEE